MKRFIWTVALFSILSCGKRVDEPKEKHDCSCAECCKDGACSADGCDCPCEHPKLPIRIN